MNAIRLPQPWAFFTAFDFDTSPIRVSSKVVARIPEKYLVYAESANSDQFDLSELSVQQRLHIEKAVTKGIMPDVDNLPTSSFIGAVTLS